MKGIHAGINHGDGDGIAVDDIPWRELNFLQSGLSQHRRVARMLVIP